MMKKLLLTAATALLLAACSRDADVVSYNISNDADNFKIARRVVFYNGITDNYILTVEGLCSVGNNDKQGEVTITCKTGPTTYKKHILGLSDNVTYFAEQIDGVNEDTFHYRVTFKPSVIVPAIELR